MKLKEVELSEFEKAVHFKTSPFGVMIGGSFGEGRHFKRNWSSRVMQDAKAGEQYVYSGEIMEDEHGNPVVVYRYQPPRTTKY